MSAAPVVDKVRWFELIDAELQKTFGRVGQGLDVVPAQRFQMEGFIAAAHADGIELDELLQFCICNAPQNCAIRINPDRTTLQFDIWQTRAPVFPSTSE
jgi:hypothetical protein